MKAFYTEEFGIALWEGLAPELANDCLTVSIVAGNSVLLADLMLVVIRELAATEGLWRLHRPHQVPWSNALQERQMRKTFLLDVPGFTNTVVCDGAKAVNVVSKMAHPIVSIPIAYLSSYRDTVLLSFGDRQQQPNEVCQTLGNAGGELCSTDTIAALLKVGAGLTVIRVVENDTHCAGQIICNTRTARTVTDCLNKTGVVLLERADAALQIAKL
jgi:hypothetical protein